MPCASCSAARVLLVWICLPLLFLCLAEFQFFSSACGHFKCTLRQSWGSQGSNNPSLSSGRPASLLSILGYSVGFALLCVPDTQVFARRSTEMGDENRRFSSKVCGQVAMQPGEGPSDPLHGGLHGAQYAASTFTMLVSIFCSLPSSHVRNETDRNLHSLLPCAQDRGFQMFVA